MDEQMREKFEEWMSPAGSWPKSIERSGDGYKLMAAQSAWEAWQACAAALSQPSAQGAPDHSAGGECGGVQAPEPIAYIGQSWGLYWYSNSTLAEFARRHGLKVGDMLYAAPKAPPNQQAGAGLAQIER